MSNVWCAGYGLERIVCEDKYTMYHAKCYVWHVKNIIEWILHHTVVTSTIHYTSYTVQYVQYLLYMDYALLDIHCTLHNSHTIYIYTFHRIHHTLRTIHSFHCPLYNMLSPMLCILWSLHNTPHTTHSTHWTNLHSTLCTLCPTSCTMPYTLSAIPKCTIY